MPSNAENYFNDITKGTDADALAFLNSQANEVFETEWLDFKGQPKDDHDTKKLWGKAITGFSNTEGGVLVWGIDAREKDDTKLDCSCGLSLIKNPMQLASQLTSLIAAATTPPTNGVVVKHYVANDEGQGFVVCYIPEGSAKPYKSNLGEKYYFIRSGTSFNDANPALLRLMFFPKVAPELEFTMTCRWNENEANVTHHKSVVGGIMTDFSMSVKNIGTISAEDLNVFCQVYFHQTYVGTPANGSWQIDDNRWKPITNEHNESGYWLANRLNPSQGMQIAQYRITLPVHTEGPYYRPNVGMLFQIQMTGKDTSTRKFRALFLKEEISWLRQKIATTSS